jgi:lipopolysaccharide/colanic/teichoic acid biosynthesis glycosyltransferase
MSQAHHHHTQGTPVATLILEPMAFSESDAYPVLNLPYQPFKRMFDIVFASTALVLLAPLMLLAAFCIALTSEGPIFYTQERVTQFKKTFRIIKFRTMASNAEAETGPTWVQRNDNRITFVGQLLRLTHIDEFPQLFNVLVGDMSIVGPRPERPVFTEQFAQHDPMYHFRHLVQAGVTGYAQMQCPNPDIKNIHEKTQADIWYVSHQSAVLDCQLILQTAWFFIKSIGFLVIPEI